MSKELYGADRRTFYGIFVKPHKQLKFAFIYITGGILVLYGLMMLVLSLVAKNYNELVRVYSLPEDAGLAVFESLQAARYSITAVTLVLVVAAMWAGIKISHHVFGPFVAFARQLEQIRNGNYSSRITLRKGDQFHDFKDQLNDLAASLEKKK